MNTNRKNEKGTALIATLMFLMAMGVLSTALIFSVQNDMKTSASFKYGQQSFAQANAAIQSAVQWFGNNYSPCIQSPGNGVTGECLATYDTSPMPVEFNGEGVALMGKEANDDWEYPSATVKTAFWNKFHDIDLTASTANSGIYAMDATLLRHREVEFMDPVTFATSKGAIERWRLESIGYWGTKAKPLGISQITATIENNGEAFFGDVLFGKKLVDLKGASLVDSFNSDLGAWSGNDTGTGSNQGMNAAVGSNLLVEMGGNSKMFGDVALAPGATYTAGGYLSGDTISLSEPRYFPPVPSFTVGTTGSQDITAGAGKNAVPVYINNGSPRADNTYRDIKVQGDLYFGAGTYYLRDLTQESGGTIHVSGNATLYIAGLIKVAGQGIINDGATVNQLTILFKGTTASFAGGSSAAVQFYGPDADLKLTGSTDYSGSFTADQVTVSGGARVHGPTSNLKNHLIRRPFRIITWSQDSY